MEKEKIKIKLDHQFQIIWKIQNSLEYLINYPNYLEEIDKKRSIALSFLYETIRDNTVLNLNKIFDPSEDYCFDRIKRYIFNEFDTNNERLTKIKKLLKRAKKLHSVLELKDIRNKHVGHLDEDRTRKTLDWKQVKVLSKLSCEIHDEMNLLLFNCQSAWEYDSKILNSILTNDYKSKKLIELQRQMFRNNIESITREKIVELNKINWP